MYTLNYAVFIFLGILQYIWWYLVLQGNLKALTFWKKNFFISILSLYLSSPHLYLRPRSPSSLPPPCHQIIHWSLLQAQLYCKSSLKVIYLEKKTKTKEIYLAQICSLTRKDINTEKNVWNLKVCAEYI